MCIRLFYIVIISMYVIIITNYKCILKRLEYCKFAHVAKTFNTHINSNISSKYSLFFSLVHCASKLYFLSYLLGMSTLL